MPSILAHAVFATATGRAVESSKMPLRFWIVTAGCAILPDVDAIGFAFGIPYGSTFGHRGFTHSIAFAVLAGVFAAALIFWNQRSRIGTGKLMIYFFLVTLSHPLLDSLTNGGLGVALLSPFSNRRFFAPWRPIEVSPIGLQFFSSSGLVAFLSEIEWVWAPSLIILMMAVAIRHRQAGGQHTNDN